MTQPEPRPRRERPAERWVLRRHPEPNARLRLFCLPHAGGDTWMFADWHLALGPEVEVCPIRLPGRGSRMSDAPYADVTSLVRAIADGVDDLLDRPFAIFGHSMGALIGFELARLLETERGRTPAMLCVAACRAPQLFNFHPIISHLPPYALIEALQQRFGVGAGVAGNQELMDLMIPVLRADLSMCETYHYLDVAPLDCPVAAYSGTDDGAIDVPSVDAWQAVTAGAFLHQTVPGDHFFPVASRGALLQLLTSDLEWCTVD